MLNVNRLDATLNNISSNVKFVLMPAMLLSADFISSLYNSGEKLILVGYEQHKMLLDNKVDAECLNPQQTFSWLKQQKTSCVRVIVSPELYPCTLSSCKTVEYGGQRFIISAFLELLISNVGGHVVLPVSDGSSFSYRQYAAGPESVLSIVTEYIAFLNDLEGENGKTKGMLLYDRVVRSEIHRLMTLQYYINSVQEKNIDKHSELLQKIIDKKKDLFLLEDKKND